jgi:hypothetical protein
MLRKRLRAVGATLHKRSVNNTPGRSLTGRAGPALKVLNGVVHATAIGGFCRV